MKNNTLPLEGFSKGLTLNTLKYLAIIAMTIDHVAFAFVPDGTVLSIAMHTIGKITGPIMFFSAVEGYHHTRNLNKYMLRLAAFAVISWFPFLVFHYGGELAGMSFLRPNVIYTIFLGVCAIRVRRSERLRSPALKVLLILALVVLCVPADWGTTGILIIITLDFYYGNFKNQAFAYCLIVLLDMYVLSMVTRPFFTLFYDGVFSIDPKYYAYIFENVGAFIPIALLRFYKGEHGRTNGFSKWFFYLFYPLHLLLLGFLQLLLR